MKFPKNRANVYIVVRESPDMTGEWAFSAITGAFADLQDADDYAAACKQEWVDKTGSDRWASFRVQTTTFYG